MTTQSDNTPENVELLIRKMRVVWLASLGSFAGLFGLTLFTARSEDAEPNNTLFLVFIAVALTTTLVSFGVKNRFFAKAEAQRQVQFVQQGFIFATAITEVAALLGVVDYFTTGDRYYYLLFLIAACGQLLHYP